MDSAKGSPTTETSCTCFLKAETKLSKMDSWTRMREVAVQIWPWLDMIPAIC